MGWFDNLTYRLGLREHDREKLLGFIWGDGGYVINTATQAGQEMAYRKCDIVTSMIGRCAESIANLRVWALDENNKEVKTRLARSIIGKMEQPNPQEDFSAFFSKLEAFIKLYGKAYVRICRSDLFGETDYYIIPNYYITPFYADTFDETYNRKVLHWQVSDGANIYELKPDEIFVFYDRRLSFGGDHVLGQSRLVPLADTISTYTILWEISGELYAHKGADNLISMGLNDAETLTSPYTNIMRGEVQEELKKYGVRRGQWRNILVKTNAKVFPLSSKIKDLDLTETIKNAKKAICNAYDCPPELIGVESSRFKTVPEARKEFYTQACIPSARFIIQGWLAMTGNTRLPFRIEPDYSHLDFYQEAKLSEAVAFQQMANAVVPLITNDIMTTEEARIRLDLE